jgi:hypothetical protein
MVELPDYYKKRVERLAAENRDVATEAMQPTPTQARSPRSSESCASTSEIPRKQSPSQPKTDP